jgi:hypothetical protein
MQIVFTNYQENKSTMNKPVCCTNSELWVDVIETQDENGDSNLNVSIELSCTYLISKDATQEAVKFIEEITLKELERVY